MTKTTFWPEDLYIIIVSQNDYTTLCGFIVNNLQALIIPPGVFAFKSFPSSNPNFISILLHTAESPL